MAANKRKKYIPVNKKRRNLIVALSVLAGLLLIGAVWAFVANYDPSPVKVGHYDDTIVATIKYTDEKGVEYTREVTYAEIRYYVKERKLSPTQALEAVQTDWVPEVMAEMYKIGLTVEDIQKMDQELEEYKGIMGLQSYEGVLASQYMTVDLHSRFLELKYLTSRIRMELTEEKDSPLITGADRQTIMDFLSKKFYAARHIYIPEGEGAEALIQQAYNKLTSGTTFEDVLKEYNKDTAMTAKGIIFVEDAMTEDYFAEVQDLAQGELSGVLKLSKGYFIVERLNPQPLLEENFQEAALTYAVDCYHHIFADIQCEIESVKEPVFYKIDSSIR